MQFEFVIKINLIVHQQTPMIELEREFRKMLREVKADCEADKLKTYSLSLLSLFTSLCLLPVRSLMAS